MGHNPRERYTVLGSVVYYYLVRETVSEIVYWVYMYLFIYLFNRLGTYILLYHCILSVTRYVVIEIIVFHQSFKVFYGITFFTDSFGTCVRTLNRSIHTWTLHSFEHIHTYTLTHIHSYISHRPITHWPRFFRVIIIILVFLSCCVQIISDDDVLNEIFVYLKFCIVHPLALVILLLLSIPTSIIYIYIHNIPYKNVTVWKHVVFWSRIGIPLRINPFTWISQI